ncbi:MAG TPA: TolC family protein, partial [Deltaproteobacteria bacterium]|nr:TolC family protein [Deltaproteobacteria bacterium]
WNVAAVQPLFTGFALSTRYEMARYGVDLARTSRDLALMDVAYRVRDAYYTSLLARRYREVADKAVENLRSHVKDAETFYDQGIIPYNDLLKSKVALAAAMQNRERALANEESAVSSLNMLLGLSLDTRTRLADILEEGSGPELSLDTLSAEALESRPELKAMRTALINADNAVRLARSVYYPTVSLVGAYERVGDNPKADDNDYGNDHNASVGIEARWQFFEWGKTRAEVNRAIFEKYALEEQKRGLEDAVRLDVKNAFLDVGVSRANIATAREALDQARENYRITNLQYQQQVTTSTEVLDARTALSQAETSYYGSLYGYLRAIARLDRALGRMPAASAQQARQD